MHLEAASTRPVAALAALQVLQVACCSSPELAQRCRDAFNSEEGVASRLQLDVVASLLALGLAPREEVRTEQGYSLDAVVLHGGREVAIEVDGPSHFCGRTPTGATALKRRQLRAVGWALLPVPYWEWNALDRNAAAKQEFLRDALQHVLPDPEAQPTTAALAKKSSHHT